MALRPIAKLAVLPFAIAWLSVLLLVELMAFAVFQESSAAYAIRRGGVLVFAALLPLYLLFVAARLALCSGNLFYVADSTLMHSPTLLRSWAIDQIESAALAPSPIFVGRNDQLVLTLRSGETIRLSAVFSADKPEVILDRLNAVLGR